MTNEKVVNPRKLWDTKQSITTKVYDYFLSELKSGNKVLLVQAAAAKKIECSRGSIRRAVDIMQDSRVIIFAKKIHHNNEYMVNPQFVWKGDGKFHEDGIKRFLRLVEGYESREKKGEYNG